MRFLLPLFAWQQQHAATLLQVEVLLIYPCLDTPSLDAFLCLVMDEFNPIDHTDFVCTNIAAESLTFRLVVFLHVSIFQLVLQHFSNLHRNVPAANCNLTVFFIVSRLKASNTSTRRNHTGKHQTCCAVVQTRLAKLCVLKSFWHLQILVHGHGLLALNQSRHLYPLSFKITVVNS